MAERLGGAVQKREFARLPWGFCIGRRAEEVCLEPIYCRS